MLLIPAAHSSSQANHRLDCCAWRPHPPDTTDGSGTTAFSTGTTSCAQSSGRRNGRSSSPTCRSFSFCTGRGFIDSAVVVRSCATHPCFCQRQENATWLFSGTNSCTALWTDDLLLRYAPAPSVDDESLRRPGCAVYSQLPDFDTVLCDTPAGRPAGGRVLRVQGLGVQCGAHSFASFCLPSRSPALQRTARLVCWLVGMSNSLLIGSEMPRLRLVAVSLQQCLQRV